jgi:hypothetical protein
MKSTYKKHHQGYRIHERARECCLPGASKEGVHELYLCGARKCCGHDCGVAAHELYTYMDLYGARSADDGCGVAAHEQYIKIHTHEERERQREMDLYGVRSAGHYQVTVKCSPRTILYHTETQTQTQRQHRHTHTDTLTHTHRDTHKDTHIDTRVCAYVSE